MTNRVIMGKFQNDFVLRASIPGYDVLDPNLPPERLVFDSRWSKVSSIYLDTWVYVPIERTNYERTTLWFGKWFDPLPSVLLMWYPDNTSHNLSSSTLDHTQYNNNRIYNDHIELNGNRSGRYRSNGWYRVLVMTD